MNFGITSRLLKMGCRTMDDTVGRLFITAEDTCALGKGTFAYLNYANDIVVRQGSSDTVVLTESQWRALCAFRCNLIQSRQAKDAAL